MKEKEEVVKYVLFDGKNFSVYIIPFICLLSLMVGAIMFMEPLTSTIELVSTIIVTIALILLLFLIWYYIYKTRKISAIITTENLYIHHRVLPLKSIIKVETRKFCNELAITFKVNEKIKRMSLPFIQEKEDILELFHSLIKAKEN